MSTQVIEKMKCYHCGEDCPTVAIAINEKKFCCEGCRMVYQILNQSDLCNYYELNTSPGVNQRITVRKDKFAFLDDHKIAQPLITFKNDEQTIITFYLPQIHCSSCLYLLEHLYKINEGVISSSIHFAKKEAEIHFNHHKISLRQLAELLTSIGYEPYISLNNLKQKKPRINRSMIYQLGVAGFSFANIMLLSFPEYLGLENAEKSMQGTFRWLNFVLALPVFLYSAQPFYESSWKSLRHKFLNIDAPIALAIIVTFTRSVYEIISGVGAGYLDSMTGIVFFMLVGRILQDKTYQQLSFERDYTSYFPIAITAIRENKEIPTALPDIKAGDTLLIHNEELIPADGILTMGKAFIDYSFVTGESLPVLKEVGELIYAGGKQTGGNIELLVVKEVTQSYLTKLWNKEELKKSTEEKSISFVHLLSRYFTYIVFAIALSAAIYWSFYDTAKVWNVITAVLIVACPCALLLSNTFTNGNVLRILGRNSFYLRNAQAIEQVAEATHIVFDKTGTLTQSQHQEITFYGDGLTAIEKNKIAALAAQSKHPLSRALAVHLKNDVKYTVASYQEFTGKGIIGRVEADEIVLGSPDFVTGSKVNHSGTFVFVSINKKQLGHFVFQNYYRKEVPKLINQLAKHYRLSVISGDTNAERNRLQYLLGKDTTLLFNQQPEQKFQYIQRLQANGENVMMIGDGLNDAGALKQSNVGIAVAENTNSFTPASDAIIEAENLGMLPKFIQLCKVNKQIILASFILSIAYNMVGIFFAVQGLLSPLIAAILMPCSSISILIITFGSTNFFAKVKNL